MSTQFTQGMTAPCPRTDTHPDHLWDAGAAVIRCAGIEGPVKFSVKIQALKYNSDKAGDLFRFLGYDVVEDEAGIRVSWPPNFHSGIPVVDIESDMGEIRLKVTGNGFEFTVWPGDVIARYDTHYFKMRRADYDAMERR